MALVPSRVTTAAVWASSAVILTVGEVGLESDTGVVKVGDGKNIWPALAVSDLEVTSAVTDSKISDETGTGSIVDSISPTIASPIITGVIAENGAANTIVSATSISPVADITFISGTTTINTIVAPGAIATNGGIIRLIPTGLWSTGVSGNIALATTAVVSKSLSLIYDPATSKWYPSY